MFIGLSIHNWLNPQMWDPRIWRTDCTRQSNHYTVHFKLTQFNYISIWKVISQFKFISKFKNLFLYDILTCMKCLSKKRYMYLGDICVGEYYQYRYFRNCRKLIECLNSLALYDNSGLMLSHKSTYYFKILHTKFSAKFSSQMNC